MAGAPSSATDAGGEHSRSAVAGVFRFRVQYPSKAKMAKQEEVDELVTEVLPDQNFRVRLQNEDVVLAYAAGRMAEFRIRVLPPHQTRRR